MTLFVLFFVPGVERGLRHHRGLGRLQRAFSTHLVPLEYPVSTPFTHTEGY